MRRYIFYKNNSESGTEWIKAKCNNCGSFLVKDAECSGDYYPVHGFIILMSFCPDCGHMKPLLQERGQEMLSNTKKRKLAVKIAGCYNLGITETKKIALSINSDNLYDFLKQFSRVKKIEYNQLIKNIE